METRRYRVGDALISCVVESQNPAHPAGASSFPRRPRQWRATPGWCRSSPTRAAGSSMRVQAFVVERRAGASCWSIRASATARSARCRSGTSGAGRSSSASPTAGFAPERIDTVVHTHLHADHVGWDTRLEGGAWVPTFTRARHLYTARELDWCARHDNPGNAACTTTRSRRSSRPGWPTWWTRTPTSAAGCGSSRRPATRRATSRSGSSRAASAR